MNMLPRGTFASVGTPTVEELKTYIVQLGDLSQEANVVHAQVKMACPSTAKNTRDSRHKTLGTGKQPIIILLQMEFTAAFASDMDYNVEISLGFWEETFQVSAMILLPQSKDLLVWVKLLKLYKAKSL